jgi:hypothetical protein
MRSIHISSALMLTTALFATPAAFAQDFQIKGGSQNIFSAENNTTTAQDKIAVQGVSKPTAFWGVGGKFEGGWTGVQGNANMSGGVGARYAGSFSAAGGSSNYGVYASASGPTGSTNYAGYFAGNVYVNGTVTQTSDERLKLNIKDLGSSLDAIRRLKPKTYNFRHDGAAGLTLPDGNQIGFLAQDLQQIFPDLVKEVPVENPSGSQKGTSNGTILSVNQMALIPVLVKAIQEQQAEIDDLKALLGKK